MTVKFVQLPKNCRKPKNFTRRKPTHSNFRDRTGETYGRWVILGFAGFSKNFTVWLLKCKYCDYQKLMISTQINRLSMQSTQLCECSDSKHPLYSLWRKYARENILCQPWQNSFKLFREGVGQKPKTNHRLKPINKKKKLGPDNYQWIKPGRLISYNGKTQSLSGWADQLGYSRETIRQKIDLVEADVMSLKDALKPKYSRKVK